MTIWSHEAQTERKLQKSLMLDIVEILASQVCMDAQHSQSSPITKTGLISGISFLLGLLFNYFFYETEMLGIAFPLYVLFVIAGLFTLAQFLQKKGNKEVFWLLIPLLFFSAMVSVRSNELLTFLNVVASVLLLLVINEVSFGGKMKNFLILDYIRIVFLPFQFIRSVFQTALLVFSKNRAGNKHNVFSPVVKGVLMAIPVLVVFVLLLSSADLIFRQYVSNVVTIEPETISRSILVFVATLIFIGAYVYSLSEREHQRTAERQGNNHGIGLIENSIVLGSVNILFFTFIIVQFAYLFGGESTISAQGFTYAEYARRGFFELIAVAVLSFLLLLIIEKYAVKKETGHATGFKALGALLVVQVLVIMASALTRLSLYEQAYGFTTPRLYAHAFIIVLTVVLGLLLYKIYKDKKESAFAFRIFLVLTLFLAVMNILNPDAFIAQRNMERFAATGKLDIEYLSHLSDDAIPTTITVFEIPNDDVRKGFARELHWRIQTIDSPLLPKWSSWNRSRRRADTILRTKISEIEPFKDYTEQ